MSVRNTNRGPVEIIPSGETKISPKSIGNLKKKKIDCPATVIEYDVAVRPLRVLSRQRRYFYVFIAFYWSVVNTRPMAGDALTAYLTKTNQIADKNLIVTKKQPSFRYPLPKMSAYQIVYIVPKWVSRLVRKLAGCWAIKIEEQRTYEWSNVMKDWRKSRLGHGDITSF